MITITGSHSIGLSRPLPPFEDVAHDSHFRGQSVRSFRLVRGDDRWRRSIVKRYSENNSSVTLRIESISIRLTVSFFLF